MSEAKKTEVPAIKNEEIRLKTGKETPTSSSQVTN